MPGVLLADEEQGFADDCSMQPASYDEGLFSPPSPISQPQIMRNNSVSGSREVSVLSNSAPVYNRSESALSSLTLHGFSQFCSPPSTPKKFSNGFVGTASDVNDELSVLSMDSADVLTGFRGAPLSSPSSLQAGNQGDCPSELRSYFDHGSSIGGSPTIPGSPIMPFAKILPSNDDDETWGDSGVGIYACDNFRMYEFKVRRCMRGRSHDWTECPFAHPGEKARRRDPRRFHYSGTACPDFRKGSCRRGDACEYAHGVFECWLHPARYRTQPCKDGRNCRRRVCFFAHTNEQMRLLPAAQAAGAGRNVSGFGLSAQLPQLSSSYDGSPLRNCGAFEGGYSSDASSGTCPSLCPPSPHGSTNGSMWSGCAQFDGTVGGSVGGHNIHCCVSPHMSSPTSTLVGHSPSPPPLSPPLSPSGSPPMSPESPQHWSTSLGGHTSQNSSQALGAAIQPTLSLPAGNSQGPTSPLSRGSLTQHAISSAAAAHNYQPITLRPAAHRRHLDRLNSMPTLSIPQVDHAHRSMLLSASSPLSSPSSCSPPSPGVPSASVNELISTLQTMNIRNSGIPVWLQSQQTQVGNQYSSGPSPLRRCSQSVPSTPTKVRWTANWEVDNEDSEAPAQRVESGRDLRAKIYGRLGKSTETEDPDLSWINELVKDEHRPSAAW